MLYKKVTYLVFYVLIILKDTVIKIMGVFFSPPYRILVKNEFLNFAKKCIINKDRKGYMWKKVLFWL